MNYLCTNDPINQAAIDIADTILTQLSIDSHVLWLLSGGSSTMIAVIASKRLAGHDLSKLFVTMTDERYGEIGHKDENWQQLLDDGFELPGATLYRPLIGQDRDKTTEAFNDWLALNIKKVDYKIGIFGFGSDGHTAGIKPHSPAATSTDLASSFTSDDFERITITFPAISQLDEAVIQASGADKLPVIRQLLRDTIDVKSQPAQILKTIPRVTLYTNNKKEEI